MDLYPLVFALSRMVVVRWPLRDWLLSSGKQMLGLLLGIAVIGAGTGGFYLGYNRMVQNIDDPTWGLPSAVSWVQKYNQGRSGPDLVLFTATAHLYSWEWPNGQKFGYTPVWRLHWLQASGAILLLLLGIGLFPWKRLRSANALTPSPPFAPRANRAVERENSRSVEQKESVSTGAPAPCGLLLDCSTALPSLSLTCPLDGSPVEPLWRRGLWLAIWIIIPCYGFYCFSMREFTSPFTWFLAAGDLFAQHWIVLAVAWVLLAAAFAAWPVSARSVAAAGLVAAATAFVIILLNTPWTFTPVWRDLAGIDGWVGLGNALWNAGVAWMDWMGQTLVMGALAIALPPLLWHFSGPDLGRRTRQTCQFLGVTATCLLLCLTMYWLAQAHYRSDVRKLLEHHEEVSNWNALVQEASKDHGVPSRDPALRRILADRPAAPPAVAQHAADDLVARANARWDALIAPGTDHDSAAQAAAQQLAAEQLVWSSNWASGWMPRYLGEIWPALAIAACCLLLRLPPRALRWSAITLLLALNATQTGARLLAGSEPPTQIIAADIFAAQPKTADGRPTNSRTRTYFAHGIDSEIAGHPGTLSLLGSELKYYLAVGGAKLLRPREFRDLGRDLDQFQRVEDVEIVMVGGHRPSMAQDLQNHLQTQRIILWEHLPVPRPGVDLDAHQDPVNLGDGWRLVSQARFVGRMH